MCRGPSRGKIRLPAGLRGLRSGLLAWRPSRFLGGLVNEMPPAFQQIVGGSHHLPFGVDLVPAAMPHPRPAELFHLAEHRLDYGFAARVEPAPRWVCEPFAHLRQRRVVAKTGSSFPLLAICMLRAAQAG